MSCEPFQEFLAAELDGELSAEEKVQLELHLTECAACRSLQERLQRMEAGFAHLPEAAPPPLRARPTVTPLPTKEGSSVGVAALWSTVLAAAACAAVVLWNPANLNSGGSELYFGAQQLLHQPPQEQALSAGEFRSPPLQGKVSGKGQLAFEIHLDSDHRPCRDLQLEVEYDFDGDGQVDRKEVYAAFDTDGQEGWEVYTHRHGPISEQGEMRDFDGGTVACRLKNASGDVQLLQGNSKLVLPHRLNV